MGGQNPPKIIVFIYCHKLIFEKSMANFLKIIIVVVVAWVVSSTQIENRRAEDGTVFVKATQ